MVDHMSAGSRDPKARYDIGALDQRVFGLEKAVNDISSSIAALGTKIDERSRTPWVTIIASFTLLLGFMTTIGVMVYQPIKADIDRLEHHTDQFQDQYVTDLKDEIKLLRMHG